MFSLKSFHSHVMAMPFQAESVFFFVGLFVFFQTSFRERDWLVVAWNGNEPFNVSFHNF